MADAELGAAILAVGRLRPAAGAAASTLAGLPPLTELAAALVTLAARLTATKRTAAAAKSLAEAVALHRRALEIVTAAGQDRYAVLVELAATGLRLAEAHDALDREAQIDQTITSGAARTAKCLDHVTARAAALKEVVACQREMERLRPERHLKDLTATLRQLSSAQSMQSHEELALAGLEESLSYYRELVRDLPDTFLPELAACLSSLSTVLASLGRRDAAKASATEAVKIYRDLNASLPEMASTLTVGLSHALATLGATLERQMLYGEAVEAHKENVALKRGLAAADPDEHLYGLSTALNNLAVSLGAAHRSDESLEAMREALAIEDTLLKAMKPNFVFNDHANNLLNYGVALCRVGRVEEALAPITKAVKTLRAYEAEEPGVYKGPLAITLENLAVAQIRLGMHEQGRRAALEGLELLRELSREKPAIYLPELAAQASNVGALLTEPEDLILALEVLLDDAVLPFRRLYSAQPSAFLRGFYLALVRLGDVQARLGLAEEAAATRAEAAQMVKR